MPVSRAVRRARTCPCACASLPRFSYVRCKSPLRGRIKASSAVPIAAFGVSRWPASIPPSVEINQNTGWRRDLPWRLGQGREAGPPPPPGRRGKVVQEDLEGGRWSHLTHLALGRPLCAVGAGASASEFFFISFIMPHGFDIANCQLPTDYVAYARAVRCIRAAVR